MNELRQRVWPMTKEIFEATTKAMFWVLTLLVGVIAYQGQAVIQSVSNHEVRLTTIEASRYTQKDATEDYKEYTQQIRGLVAQQAKDADAVKQEIKDFVSLHVEPIREDLKEIKEAVKENRDARN